MATIQVYVDSAVRNCADAVLKCITTCCGNEYGRYHASEVDRAAVTEGLIREVWELLASDIGYYGTAPATSLSPKAGSISFLTDVVARLYATTADDGVDCDFCLRHIGLVAEMSAKYSRAAELLGMTKIAPANDAPLPDSSVCPGCLPELEDYHRLVFAATYVCGPDHDCADHADCVSDADCEHGPGVACTKNGKHWPASSQRVTDASLLPLYRIARDELVQTFATWADHLACDIWDCTVDGAPIIRGEQIVPAPYADPMLREFGYKCLYCEHDAWMQWLSYRITAPTVAARVRALRLPYGPNLETDE